MNLQDLEKKIIEFTVDPRCRITKEKYVVFQGKELVKKDFEHGTAQCEYRIVRGDGAESGTNYYKCKLGEDCDCFYMTLSLFPKALLVFLMKRHNDRDATTTTFNLSPEDRAAAVSLFGLLRIAEEANDEFDKQKDTERKAQELNNLLNDI